MKTPEERAERYTTVLSGNSALGVSGWEREFCLRAISAAIREAVAEQIAHDASLCDMWVSAGAAAKAIREQKP